MATPLLQVDDVSVTYRTSVEGTPTLKNTLMRMGRRQRVVREVEALKNRLEAENVLRLKAVRLAPDGKSVVVSMNKPFSTYPLQLTSQVGDLSVARDSILRDLRAALTAAPAPAQPACCLCDDRPQAPNDPCGACGKTAPQPDADEREAMVAVLKDALWTPCATEAEDVADALLAAGWTRGTEAEKRGAERMRERAAQKQEDCWKHGVPAVEHAKHIRALPLTKETPDADA